MLGGKDITYRMYAGGMKSLWQGWLKNYASGAFKSPLLLFLAILFIIASSISSFTGLIQYSISKNVLLTIVYGIFYLLWVCELFRVSRKLGNFNILDCLIYPVYLLFFVAVFFLSVIKKVFRLKVVWKDRKIKLEK